MAKTEQEMIHDQMTDVEIIHAATQVTNVLEDKLDLSRLPRLVEALVWVQELEASELAIRNCAPELWERYARIKADTLSMLQEASATLHAEDAAKAAVAN
jgi:hypothetical protein